jgi:hypothetical protein
MEDSKIIVAMARKAKLKLYKSTSNPMTVGPVKTPS